MSAGKTLIIPNTIGGARLAKPFNDNFAEIADVINGKLGASNIAAEGVERANIAPGAIDGSKIAAGSLGISNFSTGLSKQLMKTANSTIACDGENMVQIPKDGTALSETNRLEIAMPDLPSGRLLVNGVLRYSQAGSTNTYHHVYLVATKYSNRVTNAIETQQILGESINYAVQGKAMTLPIMAMFDVAPYRGYYLSLQVRTDLSGNLTISGDPKICYSGFSYQLVAENGTV